MRLLAELEAEHALIDQALGALRTYVRTRLDGADDRAPAARFVRFFRTFVGGYHHDREELVLFPALARELALPVERGPIAAMLTQHHELAAQLDALAVLLDGALDSVAERTVAEALSKAYAERLWQHLDAENSVLFPESASRLGRAGVYELPTREPSDDEAAARADGEQLVREFPPVYDPSVLRGEGCIMCPSFGVSCDGIEHEWWNESEWSDFLARDGD